MYKRDDVNIRNAGRDNTTKAVVYVVCTLIIILCILLDIYFILGIAG